MKEIWRNLDGLPKYIVELSSVWETVRPIQRKGNVLFNDALNTFYLRLYHSDSERKPAESHMDYAFRLTARVLLYARSHRRDSTYHGRCYTSCGALAGTRNSSMGPPHEGSIRRPIAPWANALTTELHLASATDTRRCLSLRAVKGRNIAVKGRKIAVKGRKMVCAPGWWVFDVRSITSDIFSYRTNIIVNKYVLIASLNK